MTLMVVGAANALAVAMTLPATIAIRWRSFMVCLSIRTTRTAKRKRRQAAQNHQSGCRFRNGPNTYRTDGGVDWKAAVVQCGLGKEAGNFVHAAAEQKRSTAEIGIRERRVEIEAEAVRKTIGRRRGLTE